MDKKIRIAGLAVLICVWGAVAAFAWFSPPKEISYTERRYLAQPPAFKKETLLSGRFMTDFDRYVLDQFPARDAFRRLKAIFHYQVLNQSDNNGIYLVQGHAAKIEHPLKPGEVAHATGKLNWIYENLLAPAGSSVFCAVVPDKGYYLAAENGYLSMNYQALFQQVRQELPWAVHLDITDNLDIGDYYFTDTHWRQEKLLTVAEKLTQAMGMPAPKPEDYVQTALPQPFYGVYQGQAALPLDAEIMYIMQSQKLDACRVYNYATKQYGTVYDMEKQSGKDLYEVFLSGAQSLLRIENPNAATQRELIVFRDSFGSSLVPLLVSEYASVTLVDIRYISSQLLSTYLEFNGQDVLLLYSTTVLNNGTLLK